MSVNIGVTGGLQTPKFTTLAGAARTKVYDAFLSNGDTVVAVNYLNNTAGAITVLLEYFDGSAYWPMDKRPIAANGRDLFQDFPVRLRQNFSIHATGAANLTVGIAVVTDFGPEQHGKGRVIVGPLPLADVDRVWPRIAGWMDAACRRGRGSMTAWEIYQGCRCGSMLLFLVWLDDEIKAAIPCRIHTVPEGQALYVVAMGGREMKRWLPELYAFEWPKSVGIKFVDWEGREGLRRIEGAKVVRQVFRKEL